MCAALYLKFWWLDFNVYSSLSQMTALSNIEAKKKFEFLEAVSGSMDAHLRYFKQVNFTSIRYLALSCVCAVRRIPPIFI